jgi:hypothetical protein
MGLASRFFRGNARLESCLVSDPSHVSPGSSGEHVGQIQQALILLDGAVIAAGELSTLHYGSSTAAAVLKYKAQREIINRSYQKTADNIVGKMTMARLDGEMVPFEGVNPEVTDPGEGNRIQALLDKERPGTGQMIQTTLAALNDVQTFFANPQSSAALAPQNQFALDGLRRFFGVDQTRPGALVQIRKNYQAYQRKFVGLRAVQRPAPYGTLLRNHFDLLENGQLTGKTPPAFSATPQAMFFTPRYRAFNPQASVVFRGLFSETLQGIQLHEMGHFFFGFIDGDPRNKPTSLSLRLASSYDLLARQITFKHLVAVN